MSLSLSVAFLKFSLKMNMEIKMATIHRKPLLLPSQGVARTQVGEAVETGLYPPCLKGQKESVWVIQLSTSESPLPFQHCVQSDLLYKQGKLRSGLA